MKTFSGRVRSLSSEGYGVVQHPEGKVFFVPGAWPGDEVNCQIESEAARFGYAKLLEVTTPSPNRVEAPCVYQGIGSRKCGGCPWMHASYEDQLVQKTDRLRQMLTRSRLTETIDTVLQPIIAAKNNIGYRNRAQFKADGKRLGFLADGTHEIVDVEQCLVLNDQMNRNLKYARSKLRTDLYAPGDGNKWVYVDLDDDWHSKLKLELNQRRPFKQGNESQNRRMQTWLRAKLEAVPKTNSVLELFAGSGNFTRSLSELGFEKILAVEIVGDALQKLESAKLPGVRCWPADLFRPAANQAVAREIPDAKILVLDPPRDGFVQLGTLVDALPTLETVIYISCDQATWARDAKVLTQRGYRLVELTPIDLSPHTPHLEIMTVFTK